MVQGWWYRVAGLNWLTIATVVNAITVVALAIITRQYAASAKRQADAAEGQARASSAQANAAQSQATAAQAQASAALRTLEVLAQRAQDELTSARRTISAAIESGLRHIEFWADPPKLVTLAVRRAVPSDVYVVPANAAAAVEAAGKHVPNLVSDLGAAFDNLRFAEMRIESLRSEINDIPYAEEYVRDVSVFLAEAKRLLDRSRVARELFGIGQTS